MSLAASWENVGRDGHQDGGGDTRGTCRGWAPKTGNQPLRCKISLSSPEVSEFFLRLEARSRTACTQLSTCAGEHVTDQNGKVLQWIRRGIVESPPKDGHNARVENDRHFGKVPAVTYPIFYYEDTMRKSQR